jgi:hypothetical protein
MTTSIAPVRPGDPLEAAWAESVREAVQKLSGGRVPAGLMAAIVAGVRAAGAESRFVYARIVAVSIAPGASGIDGAYLPSAVTYSVRGIDHPGIDLTGVSPWYGRPVRNDEARIYPARVHDTCLVEKSVDIEGTVTPRLMLLPGCEVVARRTCGG